MQERGPYDHQDQPPYPQASRQPLQPPYQYQTPYRPPARKKPGMSVVHALGIAVLSAVFVAVVAAIAAGVAFSAKHKTQNASVSAQSGVGSPAPAAGAGTGAASAPASSAAPTQTVVLNLSGSGEQTTQAFSTGPDWGVTYSYDCSSFGSEGNFILTDETGMPMANVLGTSGSATTYQHDDAGRHYLQVDSECSWTLQVTDGVGG